MKKLLKLFIVGVLVLVVVVGIAFYFLLNSIVKAGVETIVPVATGTPAKLDSANISIFSGAGSLNGFVVGNPQGFKTDSAFEFAEVRVALDVKSLLSDKIVIEEIYINAPQVTYEAALGGSNISKIKEHIDKLASEEEKKPAEQKSEGKKVQINRFVMENGSISLSASALGGEKVSVPLPKTELKDIGKESDGKSPAEVAKEIFTPLAGAIDGAVAASKNLLGEGAGSALEKGKEGLKGAADSVKGLLK